MNKSESIKELSNALAKAQAKLKNPAFDSTNPHFKSKYASLASVRDTVIPTLSEHGLSVVQMPMFVDGRAGCETILTHVSGEWISETLLIPVDKPNAHGVGSCITYSRRFSLMAFAGVVGDVDDDGNAAVSDKPKPAYSAPITPTVNAWDAVTPARKEFITRLADEAVQHAAKVPKMSAAELYNAKPQSLIEVYKTFYGNIDEGKIDNDEATAIWDSLKSYSMVRNTLKKLRDERTGKLAETA